MMQLTDLLSKAGVNIQVTHVLEIYARGIQAEVNSVQDQGQA
jgi:hypothetical protein